MTNTRLAFIGDPSAASPWLLQAVARAGVFEALCHTDASATVSVPVRWIFSDVAELLREAEPDGVILSVPFPQRATIARQCLASRAAVLLLGPPGPLTAARRLGVLAKLTSRFVLAAPPSRFSPAILLARRLLESGRMPPPIAAKIVAHAPGFVRGDPPNDGPVDMDTVFETMDLLHSLLGPVHRVFALGHEDGALSATLSAGSPPRIVSLLATANTPSEQVGIEFDLRAADGSHCTLTRSCELDCSTSGRQAARHAVNVTTSDPVVELGYAGLLREFVASIELARGDQGLIGPALSVIAASELVLASARQQRPLRSRPARNGRGGTQRPRRSDRALREGV